MQALFQLMSGQHGVASSAQARSVGVSRPVERRLVRDGIVDMPCPGVLTAAGAPLTFRRRAMAAALSTGVTAISHGAAARLHDLDGFEHHEQIDVLGTPGAKPHRRIGVTVHFTRADIGPYVEPMAGIPTLTVAATLALLAPAFGIGRTARALESALRAGVETDDLRRVATAWRRPGRAGPPALLMLLGERVDQRLPRSWFQRLAAGVLARVGVRLVDEHPVRDERGVLLAELDLADPVSKVGIECQSWQWHATPASQHHDARRRGVLRQLGWEIVDVWWSDLRSPDRVIAELTYLLRTRTPSRQAEPHGSDRFPLTRERSEPPVRSVPMTKGDRPAPA